MEVVVAIAALAGIVWGAVIFIRGGLLAGSLCVLLAGTCFGYPLLAIPTQPIPITFDRILWIVLMVQLFLWWRSGLTERYPIRRTELLLLALVGVLAVSIATHDWTVNRNLPLSRFLFYYLMPVGMYWVGRQAKITERGMTTMFVILGAFGVYVALTAIAEAWELESWIFPRYIVSEDYASFLGRARGPLLNPAANGVLLAMCLGGGLMTWPRANRLGRLILLAFAGLMVFAIYCTMTRSAWMGGALGLAIVVFLSLPRFYRPWFVGATVLGAAVLLATQWEHFVEFKRDKHLDAHQTASSAELRPILATIAWQMFTDQPILGCGFGHYTDQHVNFLADRSIDLPLEEGRPYVQHNSWLALLAETGLIGATLVILIQLSWTRTAWQLWTSKRAPLWMRQQGLLFFVVAASYLMNGLFQDVVIMSMIQMYLFFMAGLTVNLQARSATAGSHSLALWHPTGARWRGGSELLWQP